MINTINTISVIVIISPGASGGTPASGRRPRSPGRRRGPRSGPRKSYNMILYNMT